MNVSPASPYNKIFYGRLVFGSLSFVLGLFALLGSKNLLPMDALSRNILIYTSLGCAFLAIVLFLLKGNPSKEKLKKVSFAGGVPPQDSLASEAEPAPERGNVSRRQLARSDFPAKLPSLHTFQGDVTASPRTDATSLHVRNLGDRSGGTGGHGRGAAAVSAGHQNVGIRTVGTGSLNARGSAAGSASQHNLGDRSGRAGDHGRVVAAGSAGHQNVGDQTVGTRSLHARGSAAGSASQHNLGDRSGRAGGHGRVIAVGSDGDKNVGDQTVRIGSRHGRGAAARSAIQQNLGDRAVGTGSLHARMVAAVSATQHNLEDQTGRAGGHGREAAAASALHQSLEELPEEQRRHIVRTQMIINLLMNPSRGMILIVPRDVPDTEVNQRTVVDGRGRIEEVVDD